MNSVELASYVVAAFVPKNRMLVDELPGLISDVHRALRGAGRERAAPPGEAGRRPTRADIRISIRDDALVSFEDGRAYKMLRRHLATRGLTPEEYRAKWGPPADYPTTAPGYSAVRSQTARAHGLGRRTRGRRATS